MMDLDREIIPSIILEDEVTYERVIASRQFMSDDNFIHTDEFKYFWLRDKLKEFYEEEIQKNYKNNAKCTPQEARELVKNSDILLVPRWDV